MPNPHQSEIAQKRVHHKAEIFLIPSMAIQPELLGSEKFAEFARRLSYKHVILVDDNCPVITGKLQAGHFSYHTIVSFLSNLATGMHRDVYDFYLLVTDEPLAVGNALASRGVFAQTNLITAPEQPTEQFRQDFASYVAKLSAVGDSKVRDVILTGSLLEANKAENNCVRLQEIDAGAKNLFAALLGKSMQSSAKTSGHARF